MSIAVGIDLGTTYSVVAHVGTDGVPAVVPNERGRAITPSVIWFDSAETVVGDEAKERQAAGDEQVAAFFKRSMGDANFALPFNGRSYTPVDLSALVLAHLKAQAEQRLGDSVTQAVITVPAYFNNMQRLATIEAGRRAGLDVLSIVSEPTAAALSYGLRPGRERRRFLVYDLGGGTFDISLVEVTEHELRVLATDGDHRLGGKDWDDRLIEHLAHSFAEEFGVPLVGPDFQELLTLAEGLKRTLSALSAGDVVVHASGMTGRYRVTRAEFEEWTRDLLERTSRLTETVLQDAGLTWPDLDGVLPVGGSTRMPMVRDLLARLSGKPPMTGVNPDEAVALGAAIQAALDLEAQAPAGPQLLLSGRRQVVDVMSHSLGLIATNSDDSRYINSIIIRKNQPIPSNETRPYQLRLGRSGDRTLEVYLTQGETDDPQRCAYLGRYVFTGFPPEVSGPAVLDVNYAYDQSGVVSVSAIERSSGWPLQLSIEPLPEDIPTRFAGPPAAQRVRQHLTVYLAVDLSGSMSGTPLAEAKKAARAFVNQCDLSATSIGLIAFSDTVHVDLSASESDKKVEAAIQGLSIGRTGGGNDGQPFDEIYKRLNQVGGGRYAIVLTDGVWSDQSHAIKQAKRCHELGIEVIAIGFGSADKKFLKQISTGDQSIFTNLSNLSETFSSIARELTESSGSGSLSLGARARTGAGIRR